MAAQSEDAKVVHFFVGVGKCGTSWLYEFLKRYDLISVPTLKEPYLIDKAPEKQAAIVEKLYSRYDNMSDFSTLYYWDPDNAQKIKDYNPEARILITTRLPSKRIISHYGFLRRNGLVREDTLAAYLAGSDPEEIVARSRYREMIARYKDVFGAEQVILLPLEQLDKAPQLYADRLCDFLGVRRVELTDEDVKPVLKKARARSMVVARVVKFSAETMRRLGFLTILGSLKSSTLVRSILFKEVTTEDSTDLGPRADEIAALDADYANLIAENGVKLTP